MKRVNRGTVLLVLLCAASALRAENFPHDYVTYEDDRMYVPIPRAYTTTRVIRYIGAEYGSFSNAQDLFIDSRDLLYVVDTDRNRVLKMSPEGEVLAVFRGDKKGFKKPVGVFVDEAGDVFVADTENSRIVHLTADGEFVEEFGEPRSGILGSDFTYYPQKLFISGTGFIYVIRGETIMILDAQNNFRGYLGQTHVGFKFTDWLVNIIASEEQKAIIANRYAARYTNLIVDQDGIIYATCYDEKHGQIKKLNAVGENMYKEHFYGERDYVEGIGMRLPQLLDLAVSDSGIITVLEVNQSKLFQYDQEGNLVAAFGGQGSTKGRLSLPRSIALDSQNRIYVLENNAIQVLEPTYFIQTVHNAIAMYAQGRYEEAYTLWKEVQRMDENYRLAASGIAKALHKQGKWDQALVQYKTADDAAGYSTTFVEFRHERFRRLFTVVVLVIVALAFVLYRVVIVVYRRAKRILDTAEASTREAM